jgi:tripartite-type tricarboxylate transporter receptor subunit TctC
VYGHVGSAQLSALAKFGAARPPFWQSVETCGGGGTFGMIGSTIAFGANRQEAIDQAGDGRSKIHKDEPTGEVLLALKPCQALF